MLLFLNLLNVSVCRIHVFWSTAKMIGLPQVFWHEYGIGGGVIQVRHTYFTEFVYILITYRT